MRPAQFDSQDKRDAVPVATRTAPSFVPEREKQTRGVLSRIFPCHLAPIDAFFCTDDSDQYPMTSIIHLDFNGRVVKDCFDVALAGALDRHPLLRAVIRPVKRGKPCWVGVNSQKPFVDWGTASQPVPVPSQGIDLSRETGVRFWIRRGRDESRLTLEVHHACTDGIGVYRFLGDLLALYAAEYSRGARPAELFPLDSSQLKHRRRKMAGHIMERSFSQTTREAIAEGYRIFGPRISPLAVPPGISSGTLVNSSHPGLCTYEFTTEEHMALRQAASHSGAMVNDLLLAEMFRAIAIWNDRFGRRGSSGKIRIMMPFDMRDQHDYSLPASNMTAYTFLTRSTTESHDSPNCLRTIREETSRIKSGKGGTNFVDAIMVAEKVPYLLPYLLRRERCLSTVTLSNVGDPTKRFTAKLEREDGRVVAGNLVLERIVGVPPLRRQTHATLAVFSYLRKLTICVRCDMRKFTISHTQDFLETYVACLQAHLDRAATIRDAEASLRRSA